MDDAANVQCPYCFEWLELYVDPDTTGSFVQDCDVCCHPWQVYVERDGDGAPVVMVSRAQ
jgi:hypothetical protein